MQLVIGGELVDGHGTEAGTRCSTPPARRCWPTCSTSTPTSSRGSRPPTWASRWERDTGASLRAARALNFGCVWIDDHLPFLSEMPHGGFGQSGYGKDLSVYALEEYTRIKHVMASLA